MYTLLAIPSIFKTATIFDVKVAVHLYWKFIIFEHDVDASLSIVIIELSIDSVKVIIKVDKIFWIAELGFILEILFWRNNL